MKRIMGLFALGVFILLGALTVIPWKTPDQTVDAQDTTQEKADTEPSFSSAILSIPSEYQVPEKIWSHGTSLGIGTNLQTNGSFETWSGTPSNPDGWTKQGSGSVSKVTGGVDSTYATHITGTNTFEVSASYIPVLPNTTYTMTVWAKDMTSNTSTGIWGLSLYDINHTALTSGATNCGTYSSSFDGWYRYINDTMTWIQHSFSCTLPNNASYVKIKFGTWNPSPNAHRFDKINLHPDTPILTLTSIGRLGLNTDNPETILQVGKVFPAGYAPMPPFPSRFWAGGTYTLTSGDSLVGAFVANQSIGTSGTIQALEGYAHTSNPGGSTVNQSFATIGNLEHAGAGTLTTARAGEFSTFVSGAGTITHARAANHRVELLGSSTGHITNAYGTMISINDVAPGTITNGYGIYINDLAANNAFGIYQTGSNDKNYFAGNVGIGTQNPKEKLDIDGGRMRIAKANSSSGSVTLLVAVGDTTERTGTALCESSFGANDADSLCLGQWTSNLTESTCATPLANARALCAISQD